MKQIKLESLVKTDRTGTNEYGLWVIYDVLADGEKYSWFRSTNLKGVVDELPEVGAMYIVTVKPNKNPKYQPSIKFEDKVEDKVEGSGQSEGKGPKIAQSEPLWVAKLEKKIDRILEIQKLVYPGLPLVEPEKVETDSIDSDSLPF